jgi:hypothetical protein
VPRTYDPYDSDSDDKESDSSLNEYTTAGIGSIGKSTKKNGSVIGSNMWLADSGASCHLTNLDEGMYDVQFINPPIEIGIGQSLRATKLGKVRCMIVQANGTRMEVTPND